MPVLQIVSDLHTEFGEPWGGPEPGVDILVMAGDIGNGLEGLELAKTITETHDVEVVYVAGNHEFYGHDLKRHVEDMRSFSRDIPRLYFLEKSTVTLQGITFVGCTMWSDLSKPEDRWEAEAYMADYEHILSGNRPIWAQETHVHHMRSVAWLTLTLLDTPNAVVVTHHLPSKVCVAEEFKDSTLVPCFASDADELIPLSQLWVHGHTHQPVDTVIEGTRVVCNPRGYPDEGGLRTLLITL